MENTFDFYSVEISSPRKRSLYNALGKKVDYSNGLHSRKVGFKNGYPQHEYYYNVGFSDIMGDGDNASVKADEIANKYRQFPDISVRIKYHCRD